MYEARSKRSKPEIASPQPRFALRLQVCELVAMEGPLTIYDAEKLRNPTLVLAYAGWSDAAESATQAARSLLTEFSMQRYACIDTEDFLDLTVVRPHVKLANGEAREIVWPNHEFFAARLVGGDSDLLVGLGVEPHLRWKAYARSILELVQSAGVGRVVLLGAYLDDVIYSQPVEIGAFSSAPEFSDRIDSRNSSYEGPTGIVGVLAQALQAAQVPTASLWARIPHYVPAKPNARGALALLQELQAVTGLGCDLKQLETEAASFDERVNDLIDSDPELQAYVRELKRRVFLS